RRGRPAPLFALFPSTTLFRSANRWEELRTLSALAATRRAARPTVGQLVVPADRLGVGGSQPEGGQQAGDELALAEDTVSRSTLLDRKSTRLNSSHVKSSYAVS